MQRNNPPDSQRQSKNRQSNVPYNYYYNPNLIRQTTNRNTNQVQNNASRITYQNQGNANNMNRASNRNLNNPQRNSNVPPSQPGPNFRRSVPEM